MPALTCQLLCKKIQGFLMTINGQEPALYLNWNIAPPLGQCQSNINTHHLLHNVSTDELQPCLVCTSSWDCSSQGMSTQWRKTRGWPMRVNSSSWGWGCRVVSLLYRLPGLGWRPSCRSLQDGRIPEPRLQHKPRSLHCNKTSLRAWDGCHELAVGFSSLCGYTHSNLASEF